MNVSDLRQYYLIVFSCFFMRLLFNGTANKVEYKTIKLGVSGLSVPKNYEYWTQGLSSYITHYRHHPRWSPPSPQTHPSTPRPPLPQPTATFGCLSSFFLEQWRVSKVDFQKTLKVNLCRAQSIRHSLSWLSGWLNTSRSCFAEWGWSRCALHRRLA